MIVVIGSPVYRPAEPGLLEGAHGLAVAVAAAAVEAGASVQFVGKVGDDAAGDALVLALGRAGVGHAAMLRDPGHPTPILAAVPRQEAADETGEEDGSLTDAILASAAVPDDAAEAAEAAEAAAETILPAERGERPHLEAADVELALRYLGDYAVVVVVGELEPAAADAVAAGTAYAGAQLVAVVAAGARVPAALADGTVLEAPAADPDDAFARLVADYAKALDDGRPAGEAFRTVVEGAGWQVAGA